MQTQRTDGWSSRGRLLGLALGLIAAVMAGSLPARANPVTITDTVTVGSGPRMVAVTPDNQYVYVAVTTENVVSVIRASDNTVVDTIAVGDGPFGVAVTPDGEHVYVTNNVAGSVSVIRTSDNSVIGTVLVGLNPIGVEVTPNGEFVYVANSVSSGTVSVIRTSDNTVIDTVSVDANPYGVAVTPDGQFVYVANSGDGTASKIRTSDNSVVDTFAVGTGATGVDVTPDGSLLAVTLPPSSELRFFRISDNTQEASIGVGGWPVNVQIAPDGTQAYVANNGSNSVSVVRVSDGTVTKTVDVGANPGGLAIAPNGYHVYVANGGEDTVSVFGSWPGLKPTFAASESTSDGFTAQVTNYDSQFTWGVSSSAGSATISASGLVTVTGLQPGQSATVTVTTSRTGYLDGQANTTGEASASPTPPVVKKAQKPNKRSRLPKRIKKSGVTVLAPRNAATNAGQRLRTAVRCRSLKASTAGEVRKCSVSRGPKARVAIRTFGRKIKVVVVQVAAATDEYKRYRGRTVYRVR